MKYKLSIPSKIKNFKANNVLVTKNELISFEKNIKKTFEKGHIRKPIHLSGGNELPLIKIFKYISRKDYVFSTWRNHYHALLHGIGQNDLKKQILTTGSMSTHSINPFFLTSSIVGGMIPIALGTAFGLKKQRTRSKVWCFIGDMAFHLGIFNEAMQLSQNLKLPIYFVIEDNGFSVNSPTEKTWGSNQIKIPSNCIYYKYKLSFPHHGIGKYVNF